MPHYPESGAFCTDGMLCSPSMVAWCGLLLLASKYMKYGLSASIAMS